jgi:hypothetical protein
MRKMTGVQGACVEFFAKCRMKLNIFAGQAGL